MYAFRPHAVEDDLAVLVRDLGGQILFDLVEGDVHRAGDVRDLMNDPGHGVDQQRVFLFIKAILDLGGGDDRQVSFHREGEAGLGAM